MQLGQYLTCTTTANLKIVCFHQGTNYFSAYYFFFLFQKCLFYTLCTFYYLSKLCLYEILSSSLSLSVNELAFISYVGFVLFFCLFASLLFLVSCLFLAPKRTV